MSRLPSKEELEQLPLRAIVAFAARCARRVLPICADYFKARGGLAAIDGAILVSERFSAGADITESAAWAAAAWAARPDADATRVARAAAWAAAQAETVASQLKGGLRNRVTQCPAKLI